MVELEVELRRLRWMTRKNHCPEQEQNRPIPSLYQKERTLHNPTTISTGVHLRWTKMDNEGTLTSAKQPGIAECLTVIEANFAFSAGIRKFLNNRHFPCVVLSKAVDTRTHIQ